MFCQPLREVVFINIENGSGCPTSGGPCDLMRLTPGDMIHDFLDEITRECSVKTTYIEPRTLRDLDHVLTHSFSSGKIFISPDNLVSFPLLAASCAHRIPVATDIVWDQHQDIYSYRTHGRTLTKANPYRLAWDQGLLERIIFLGSRRLEMAFHAPKILLPEIWRGKRSPLDFLYAWLRYFQGQHAGLEGAITAIPAEDITDFADTLFRITQKLERISPQSPFAFEIDLDVFDSQIITAVDYGPHLPQRLRHEAVRKRNKASFGMRRFFSYWYDLWIASYVEHKIQCKGIMVPPPEALEEAMLHLAHTPAPCAFFHITELKLEYDDPAQKTRRLVKDIITSAIYASQTCSK